MPCILNIETATNVCSVAVSNDGKIIFEKIDIKGPSQAALLGVFVSEALTFLREKNMTLDAVAVSCGPGSYTGLRIGVSEAKGLCYGLGIPLIAIKTPLIIAQVVLKTENISEDTLLCPMIDARRMEVYAAIFDGELNKIRPINADIVDDITYAEYLKDRQVMFFGNGADKCKEVIKSENALFIKDIYPLARYMVDLSEKNYNNAIFEDVAYFEPYYLKDFLATTPRKNIL